MEKKYKKEMVAQEVLNVYDELEKNGILIWIDGGWAVDALKGKKPVHMKI